MRQITLCTSYPQLAVWARKRLEGAGFRVEIGSHHPKKEPGLYYGCEPELGAVDELMVAIWPFALPWREDDTLMPGQCLLRFPEPFQKYELELQTALPAGLQSSERLEGLQELGVSLREGEWWGKRYYLPHTILRIPESWPKFQAQLLQWYLVEAGYPPRMLNVGEYEDAELLIASCPGAAFPEVMDEVVVEIAADDPEIADVMVDWLHAHGYCQVVKTPLDPDEARVVPFEVDLSLFHRLGAFDAANRLHAWLVEVLATEGLDLSRYPLEVCGQTEARDTKPVLLRIRIVFPLAAAKRGDKPSYAGVHLDRVQVRIHTDDAEMAAPLARQIAEEGMQVELKHCPAEEILYKRTGFLLQAGERVMAEWNLISRLEGLVCRNLLAHGLAENQLSVETDEDEDEAWRVELTYPIGVARNGKLEEALRSGRGYKLYLLTEDPERWQSLGEELKRWGFEVTFRHEDTVEAWTAKYGGAPAPLRQRLAEFFQARYHSELAFEKAWPREDNDIYLYLPKMPPGMVEEAPEERRPRDILATLPVRECGRTFLQVASDRIWVGDLVLPRRASCHPLIPDASEFEHYCLDAVTVATLGHLAESVLMREPCLLEGPTSTSKTSAIRYLASLLRRPVLRLNLNGQTDTSELIGKYVPAEGGGWRWQDGALPQAMLGGWWLILDEVNLAEPQILERINSALEREPFLLISEQDHRAIAASKVHEDFRIFATMNPASYAGRSEMSPAWRDRWLGYCFIEAPEETVYLAMLRYLVFGIQPDVVWRGGLYAGAMGRPCFPRLSRLQERMELWLVKLARFQASLEKTCCDMGHLGAEYVFTRRGLLQLMAYLERMVEIQGEPEPQVFAQGLERYYLARIHDPEQREAVVRLLEATGLVMS